MNAETRRKIDKQIAIIPPRKILIARRIVMFENPFLARIEICAEVSSFPISYF
jgi:hypothetical protein